jgi:4'-phosphopantetheinyl transferase EntD
MAALAGVPLQTAIERLAVPGIMIGHRLISPGDERALMPEEAFGFISSVAKVRRASGAARIVARELLSRAGYGTCAVPRGPSGAPIWPSGIVGSLAHDSQIAVAAVALRRNFASVGIDIEPAEALPAELVEIVATPSEQSSMQTYPYGARLLFVAKEATYKAIAALDQIFLDHHDIEVDLAQLKAVVRNGRRVDLRFCISIHLLALAFIPATCPVQ